MFRDPLFLVKYNDSRVRFGQGVIKKGVRSVLVVYSDLGAPCKKTIDCLGQLMVGDVGLRGNNDSPGRYLRGLRVFLFKRLKFDDLAASVVQMQPLTSRATNLTV